ncbi:hypothetical protein NX059_009236 [Plenodomus lindquistii]|nr:hypothetical protein NX059_009236 [Plenodomus lindquistii]
MAKFTPINGKRSLMELPEGLDALEPYLTNMRNALGELQTAIDNLVPAIRESVAGFGGTQPPPGHYMEFARDYLWTAHDNIDSAQRMLRTTGENVFPHVSQHLRPQEQPTDLSDVLENVGKEGSKGTPTSEPGMGQFSHSGEFEDDMEEPSCMDEHMPSGEESESSLTSEAATGPPAPEAADPVLRRRDRERIYFTNGLDEVPLSEVPTSVQQAAQATLYDVLTNKTSRRGCLYERIAGAPTRSVVPNEDRGGHDETRYCCRECTRKNRMCLRWREELDNGKDKKEAGVVVCARYGEFELDDSDEKGKGKAKRDPIWQKKTGSIMKPRKQPTLKERKMDD